MRVFEVTITAYRTVLVEAETVEEAFEAAQDNTRYGDFEHDTALSQDVTDPRRIERAKKTGDFIYAEEESTQSDPNPEVVEPDSCVG